MMMLSTMPCSANATAFDAPASANRPTDKSIGKKHRSLYVAKHAAEVEHERAQQDADDDEVGGAT